VCNKLLQKPLFLPFYSHFIYLYEEAKNEFSHSFSYPFLAVFTILFYLCNNVFLCNMLLEKIDNGNEQNIYQKLNKKKIK